MSDYDPNYVEIKSFFLVCAKVVLLNAHNEVLLLKRSSLSVNAGNWDLPGGAVDAHESPETGAIREVVEETGIVIDSAKILSSELDENHKDPIVILGFSAYVDNSEVVLSWEHDAYQWVSIDDALRNETLPEVYKTMIRSSL